MGKYVSKPQRRARPEKDHTYGDSQRKCDPNEGKYTGEDRVDAYLLNQVAKHVNHEEIRSFATDLFVWESVYSNIPGPKDKALIVRNMWCTATCLRQWMKH